MLRVLYHIYKHRALRPMSTSGLRPPWDPLQLLLALSSVLFPEHPKVDRKVFWPVSFVRKEPQ